MRALRVLAVCGSLQADSSHLRYLRGLCDRHVPGVEILLSDHLRHLALFNPDLLEAEPGSHAASLAAWRRALAGCDAVLMASPEYGHSLSGVLKNGIDWVIGSGELYRKPVAITTVVKHPERGLKGLAALKQVLMAVDAHVVWEGPMISGEEVDARSQDMLRALQRSVETHG